LRGRGFRASKEVVVAIAVGIEAKLADALMEALGPHFKSLSSKDVNAICGLYKATLSVTMTVEFVKVPKTLGSVAEQWGLHPPMPNRDLLLPASNLCQWRKISSPLRRMTCC